VTGSVARMIEGPGGVAAATVTPPRADDFWSTLPPTDAAALYARGRLRTFARGRALCHQGQVPDCVMVIRSGRVKVCTTTSAGREVILAFRGPGELIGEQAALDQSPRSATIVAVEPVEALSLAPEEFRSFLAAYPGAALVLLRMLSLRLRDADGKRVELSTFTTIGRVASRLLEFSERFGDREDGAIRISLPLSQEELAGSTGSSLESVGRALQTMRSLKCIETRRREIRVLDLEALEALRRAGE
jgi:CRP/FNR family cyclic AMP-dependent transcriptional regulator